jgi:hypothetical protein
MGMDNKRLWHQFEWFVVEEYVDRKNTTDVENAIAEIVNETTELDVALDDSFLHRLTAVYANYGLDAEAAAVKSLDEYWAQRNMATDGASDASTVDGSPDDIEAKRLSGERFDVPGSLPPTPPPTPKQIGAQVSHAPTPTVPREHGREVTED